MSEFAVCLRSVFYVLRYSARPVICVPKPPEVGSHSYTVQNKSPDVEVGTITVTVLVRNQSLYVKPTVKLPEGWKAGAHG